VVQPLRVRPGRAPSSRGGAHDVDALAGEGIDRVLNLVQDGEYPDGARLEVEIAYGVHHIEEVRVGIVDFGNFAATSLGVAAEQVVTWLRAHHTVYLHCRAGWQRSATVAAAVIALTEGVGIDEALGRLESRKPTAQPLPHQVEDLRRWWESPRSAVAD
jgi:protein-tyrosine phosphatase